jgi:hypothetical protein
MSRTASQLRGGCPRAPRAAGSRRARPRARWGRAQPLSPARARGAAARSSRATVDPSAGVPWAAPARPPLAARSPCAAPAPHACREAAGGPPPPPDPGPDGAPPRPRAPAPGAGGRTAWPGPALTPSAARRTRRRLLAATTGPHCPPKTSRLPAPVFYTHTPFCPAKSMHFCCRRPRAGGCAPARGRPPGRPRAGDPAPALPCRAARRGQSIRACAPARGARQDCPTPARAHAHAAFTPIELCTPARTRTALH